MTTTPLLPFQPDQMTPAQLAAVSYLARYSGHTHTLMHAVRGFFRFAHIDGLYRRAVATTPEAVEKLHYDHRRALQEAG